jgi:5'-nucleotidase / UDP-sugar diphosphatase
MKLKKIIQSITLIILINISLLSFAVQADTAFDKVQLNSSIAHLTLLHVNDVYEIMALNNGTQGGLAKLASVREQLHTKNPYTYTLLAGDLFSPSAIGTARVNGERLAGKQIVDVMNVLGLDYATFGNHEFDLKEKQFQQRLTESKFKWFSSNVFGKNSQPFKNVSEYEIIEITAPNNTVVKIALIGVSIDSNRKDYVTYADPFLSVNKLVNLLQDKVDIFIAVTHLPIDKDIKLAETVPELDLILGGHEHENIHILRGKKFTPILKADANARSAYIHDLYYDTQTGVLNIKSHLKLINENVIDNPKVLKKAQYWQDIAFAAFEKEGFNPQKVVVISDQNLDGSESKVRNEPTNLTQIIANSMLNIVSNSQLAIFNSGSIRIDDVIAAGKITEYDAIRILPFGGDVLSVTMKGSLLKRVLEQGLKNKGTGGYLQTVNTLKKDDSWFIKDKRLDETDIYTIAINDYLVSGREKNLDYLDIKNNPEIKLISNYGDIRKVLIKELKQLYPVK